MGREFLSRIPFIIALALTMAWAAMLAVYIRNLGGVGLSALAPTELATLLAAAGGPPAALWLFVAVLEQRRSITVLIGRLTEVMANSRQSLQQAETQTRALLQLQTAMSHGQSAAARDMAVHDLAANAAILAERLGVISKENAVAAWARYGAGDVTVFVQAFLNFAMTHKDMAQRMAEAVTRDGLARTALGSYVRRYQRLTHALSDDKMTLEVMDEGALGRGYRLFKQADDLASGAGIASGVSIAADVGRAVAEDSHTLESV